MSQHRITGVAIIDNEHVELHELSQKLQNLLTGESEGSVLDTVSVLYAAMLFHMRP